MISEPGWGKTAGILFKIREDLFRPTHRFVLIHCSLFVLQFQDGSDTSERNSEDKQLSCFLVVYILQYRCSSPLQTLNDRYGLLLTFGFHIFTLYVWLFLIKYKLMIKVLSDLDKRLHVHLAKTHISLQIRAVWPKSSQGTKWAAKVLRRLQGDSEDSHHPTRMHMLMRMLIWVFTGRTCYLCPGLMLTSM